ncbi:hypothetical protein [Kibdelosporangium aridum]|uniref:WD40 repeat domain-containing protein n=1 Tax=Kibdelosporangium aridum TaxID=2030 RepID=A0A1W2FBJ1_KIBAR|nr:hypothetical protein [Kibdelosporangium aridum]SMD18906.1 hypothetical protein SAMN05661093_05953 [Kibdelosporangium aridum]
MQTISLDGLEHPAERRWEHRGLPYPAEAEVLRRNGNIVAAAPVTNGPRGVGVWDLDNGKLRFWDAWGDTVRFLESGMLVVVDGKISLLSWPDLATLESVDAPYMAETFVVSPSEKTLVVHQNDGQGMNGYEVFSLGPLTKQSDHIGLCEDPMYSMPVFSPSERYVACSPGGDYFWVPDEADWPQDWDKDEAEIPSTGGQIRFGDLLVHDLATDTVARSRLRFELEPGWVPQDCWDSRWHYGAIDLEFVADEHIKLRLPDGTWVELALPLPDTVVLPTPNRELPRQPSVDRS